MPTAERTIISIEVEAIQPSPDNPRKHFDEASLAELAESIKQRGLIHPITVRNSESNGHYELIAGERRLRATVMAGFSVIDAILLEASDAEAIEIRTVENLHREDLHPLEVAYGYKVLRDRLSMSVSDIAQKVGKSERTVWDSLALLNLDDELQVGWLDGRINMTHTHAVQLVRVDPETQRDAVAWMEQFPERTCPTRALESWIRQHSGQSSEPAAPSAAGAPAPTPQEPPKPEPPAPIGEPPAPQPPTRERVPERASVTPSEAKARDAENQAEFDARKRYVALLEEGFEHERPKDLTSTCLTMLSLMQHEYELVSAAYFQAVPSANAELTWEEIYESINDWPDEAIARLLWTCFLSVMDGYSVEALEHAAIDCGIDVADLQKQAEAPEPEPQADPGDEQPEPVDVTPIPPSAEPVEVTAEAEPEDVAAIQEGTLIEAPAEAPALVLEDGGTGPKVLTYDDDFLGKPNAPDGRFFVQVVEHKDGLAAQVHVIAAEGEPGAVPRTLGDGKARWTRLIGYPDKLANQDAAWDAAEKIIGQFLKLQCEDVQAPAADQGDGEEAGPAPAAPPAPDETGELEDSEFEVVESGIRFHVAFIADFSLKTHYFVLKLGNGQKSKLEVPKKDVDRDGLAGTALKIAKMMLQGIPEGEQAKLREA